MLLGVALPGAALGLALCALQGDGEHRAAAAGVDHRGTLYNRLWFNDEFHAAHHRRPALHWSQLPSEGRGDDVTSALRPSWRGPDAVRAAPAALLDRLERVALRLAPVGGGSCAAMRAGRWPRC